MTTEERPGDVLRRAARLMRERGEAATPGPWEHSHEGLQGGEVIRAADMRVARVYKGNWINDYPPDCQNAWHIASWHPAVALAVADWLEATADWADENEGRIMLHALEPGALAVARAYLAEPPSTQRDPSRAPEEEA